MSVVHDYTPVFNFSFPCHSFIYYHKICLVLIVHLRINLHGNKFKLRHGMPWSHFDEFGYWMPYISSATRSLQNRCAFAAVSQLIHSQITRADWEPQHVWQATAYVLNRLKHFHWSRHGWESQLVRNVEVLVLLLSQRYRSNLTALTAVVQLTHHGNACVTHPSHLRAAIMWQWRDTSLPQVD